MNILVTGAAGFIGYHLSRQFLEKKYNVVGVDNLNPYYSVKLKTDRLDRLFKYENFQFKNTNIANKEHVMELFQNNSFSHVVNLAAQAGVRYSIDNPSEYIDTNIVGFANILEGCRHGGVQHLVFASSSSVYGLNANMPFSVCDNVDHPVSLYAATKKSNELMAHTYSHLYGLPCTGLRFFTVYGPWGRPDMALFLFTKAIFDGKPIILFNHGRMQRDFTYIDDIVDGVVRITERTPSGNPNWDSHAPDPSSSVAPYKIYNIGNNNTVELSHFVEIIEKTVGKKAEKQFLPIQPGDVPKTHADIASLFIDVGFKPSTSVEYGIKKFVEWYREYYQV